ncbi:MAG: inorganic diphosphatase [Microscillaceae bacterium]|jgi:inorganic pyrophosphatase|nr:inorganic diphosphatase [Microscillaceae bacterium]
MIEKNEKTEKADFLIDVVVEIPKGSRNKYEYDYEKKMIRYDRMLFSSVHYPSDYGFFPDTLAEDGDTLDALVLVTEPTFPGCIIEVRPIGVFNMRDEKGPDAKVLCVPISDPIWNHIFRLDQIPPHLKLEIEHFFKVYKDLEKKKVGVEGWDDENAALLAIKEAQKRYYESKWKVK